MEKERLNEYHSASELPSFIDLNKNITAFSAIIQFLHGDKKQEARKQLLLFEKQLDGLANLVDSFNKLLEPRHWIFTNGFGIPEMREILDTDDPVIAEQRLLDWHKARLEHILFTLNRHQGLRARMPLIRKALDDYLAGRYYSVVYVLIAVVDGFVNDFDPQSRHGLTSRKPEEMAAYDSVTAVGSALPMVAEIYQKTFRRFSDMEVHEVYRNGIMHGMLVNFDNLITATKAWNLLFAAADWAEARDKRKRQLETPAQASPSLSELFKKLSQINHDDKLLEGWKSYETGVEDSDSDPSGIRRDCTEFLNAWQNKNYMQVGSFLPNLKKYSSGKMAGQAKESFKDHPIRSWNILKIENCAAASAYMTIAITPLDGDEYMTRLHWTRVESALGMVTAPDWKQGQWVTTQWAVDPFRPNSNMQNES